MINITVQNYSMLLISWYWFVNPPTIYNYMGGCLYN